MSALAVATDNSDDVDCSCLCASRRAYVRLDPGQAVRQAREGRDAQTVTRHGSVVLHFADDRVAADLQLEVATRIPRGDATRADLAAGDLVHLRKEQGQQRQTVVGEGSISHCH